MDLVIAFAGAHRSSPAWEASIVQILPLPTTPEAETTENDVSVEVVETEQIFGVNDFKVTASLEPADDETGVMAPISAEVGTLIESD